MTLRLAAKLLLGWLYQGYLWNRFLTEILVQNSAARSGTRQCLHVPGLHLLASPLKSWLARSSLSELKYHWSTNASSEQSRSWGEMHGGRISHRHLYSVGRHIQSCTTNTLILVDWDIKILAEGLDLVLGWVVKCIPPKTFNNDDNLLEN